MAKGKLAGARARASTPAPSAVASFMAKAFKASMMNQPGARRGKQAQVPRPGSHHIRTVRGV